MTKITLTDLVNLENQTTAVSAINANNTILETALTNTLSRDGTIPNTMGATLDMNSHQIINLPAATSGTEPATKAQLDAIGNGYLGNNILLGTNNEISVTSGSGTSTFGLPTALNFTGKTVTGGTFTALTTEIPDYLSGIDAWKNGVPGDDTDQTVALQAIIDGLPVTGGEIYLRGIIRVSTIDLHGRRNIRLIGANGAGNGNGAAQSTQLLVTADGGSTAINCVDTLNVSFANLFIRATKTTFTGSLINYGVSVGGSSYMRIDNCVISSASTTGGSRALLSLHGSTNGVFNHINFIGDCIHVLMQVTTGVGFVNDHVFTGCTFHPGSMYPITGAGEGITFQSCCFQAGFTSGTALAYTYTPFQPYKGLSFNGCTFFDVLSSGGIWINAGWGYGLTITGCRFGGIAGDTAIVLGGGPAIADPSTGGCLGTSITGNFFDTFTAAVGFSGTIAAKTNARGVVIGGNSVIVGILLSNSAVAEALVCLPNSIYGAPNGLGSNVAFLGLGEFANRAAAIGSGYDTGQVYCETTSGSRYLAMV